MTTKKSQKIEINSSSIVDLKAELFRKQEEVRLKRNLNGSEKIATNEEKFLDEINDDHLYDKNAHKISRLSKKILGDDESKPAKNDKSAKSLSKLDEAVKHEEEMAFAKSRTMLEKKAKLYEQMASGSVIPDADNEELLVNFDQKSSLHYNEKASTSRHSEKTKNDEELVEYQDEFGRTRYVKRKDLPEKIEKKGEKEPDLYQPSSSWSRNSDLLSDDMKREIERREWEEETYQEMEEPSLAKRKVHYEDIREGEIRDHGVAFFNFSVDEQARAEQLEMLKQMREETENKQSEKQRIKEKRKQMLKARLAKVATRKGIALPDESSEESDNEPAEKATYIEKAKLKVDSDPVKVGRVRDWDLGKEGLFASRTTEDRATSSKSMLFSHEQFIEKRREERVDEFAPPSIYNAGSSSSVMKPATSLTASKSTSPTSRWPDFLVASGMALIPQSMTTAPGLTQSFLTNNGCPMATTRMSASRHTSGKFFVFEWHTVTVAWFQINSCAIGEPTI
ncbi:hypothetical protein TYRP_004455 [Tyrophagus putrescentiae]|nr:hypothetical protein TYRP_004455 [Tyrophagus putrescentiae]